MNIVVDFYIENKANQVHVWCEKWRYESGDLNLKCEVAVKEFGFEFKGFERVSKWSGKEIVKLEKIVSV